MDKNKVLIQKGEGKAVAKAILFGEHAVVYGEPGIAIPLPNLQLHVTLTPNSEKRVLINSPAIGMQIQAEAIPESHPIRKTIQLAQETFKIENLPGITLEIRSSIPVAAGLGSGAALTTAILRAFSNAIGKALPLKQLSALTLEIEKIYHGTPSGIDNTTICYQQPIFYIKDQPIERIQLGALFPFLLVHAGEKPSTAETVNDVRKQYDSLKQYISQIGEVSRAARISLEQGNAEETGRLMNENQRLLNLITVSNEKIEMLCAIARQNGALGAKLSGAGRGGNIILLAKSPADIPQLMQAMETHGARGIQ